MKIKLLILILLCANLLNAQSYKYAHYCLDSLISKEFKGRGYYEDGDRRAANFIERELRNNGVKPVKNNLYQQKLPIKVKVYHNFRWVGLEPPPEIWEIDNMKLVYLGFMSRSELEEFILNG